MYSNDKYAVTAKSFFSHEKADGMPLATTKMIARGSIQRPIEMIKYTLCDALVKMA